MSLGGIAIAIGAMVDAAIVMIENAHKHLERAPPGQAAHRDPGRGRDPRSGRRCSSACSIITVSFLPIFTLEAQEGRLFSPLAFTKTFSMAAAALLSVTLVPALMVIFVRGRIIPEAKNPINRVLIWHLPAGDPRRAERQGPDHRARACVPRRDRLAGAQLGSEFMPTLNEGTLLYMPTTLPGLSVTKAAELLQTQDRIIKTFPEVAIGLRQGGPGADRDRSGADRDVRDRHQPQAEGRMAARA